MCHKTQLIVGLIKHRLLEMIRHFPSYQSPNKNDETSSLCFVVSNTTFIRDDRALTIKSNS